MASTNSTDYVIQNNILKSLEVLERKARKDWDKKWKFYLDFNKFILDEAAKLGYTEKEYKRIVQQYKHKPIFYQEESVTIPVEPTQFVPKTSSAFVGWRADKKFSLEKFGPLYISPKVTLPHQPPCYTIFLG
ncbi:uncharacterized protein C20orf85 homolog [Diorhabda sublineata]|uniref:uncharacterized protein C20orf85 homolog n=1 Tax=Diorhabda sublineata TaxID=1163346 RepID=UPI0024E05474|nr:uncharacterized protein C20orf85 homolog [Diorhabda sublineata]